MKHKKTLLGIGIVFLFAVFGILPFFGKGYIPTHDGEYHIIRFLEFYRMLRAGYWFPRWAPTLNSGYGIPIFIFHYPFPNYAAALIQSVGFHAVDALKLSLASGYVLSGIISFLWLKKIFGVKAGLVGAVLASFVPYWFVDLYVRGSVGEVWAIPFVFSALMFSEYRMFIPFSFAVAGLILSHNILAMLFIPFIFGYTVIRNRQFVKGILYGALLSSYFWIPAFFERLYVVGLNTVNFREHFPQAYELIIPSWGTELSGQMFGGNKMSFQIGIIPLLLIIGSIIIILRGRNKRTQKLYWYFFVVFIFSTFFMTPCSKAVWEKLSMLQFVQYPWRFLSFMIPVTAFVGAFVSYHTRMRFISMILVFASVILSYSYMRPVAYPPRDNQYYLSRKNFTDSTSSMGNSFSTIWTGWKSKRAEYLIEVINGKVTDGFTQNSYLQKKFSILSETGAQVHLSTLYYPGWKVNVDNTDVDINYLMDGTIQFPVPSGSHHVSVSFTRTFLRMFADALSILTLVWITGWGILGVYANSHKLLSVTKRAYEPRRRGVHKKPYRSASNV